MRTFILLLFLAFIFAPYPSIAQANGLRVLSGKVVEMTNGKPVGVSGVRVSIKDFHYDITQTDGSFRLKIPSGKDFVTIVLEDTPEKMIAPMSGLVNLPPDQDLQVIICGEQNQKLLQEVNRLSSRIRGLEKEKNLSKRQAAAMYQTLLDTVIFFQNQVKKLESENAARDLELAEKKRQMQALENTNQNLVQALEAALEEKYLRQKAEFDQVSKQLLAYIDRLKDLHDRSTPTRLQQYFRNTQASYELTKTIGAYNEARNPILNEHENHLVAVRQNWASPEVALALEQTYGYILEDIHQGIVLPIDAQVYEQVRSYASSQIGRGKAEKNARNAADVLVPKLTKAIQKLEEQVDELIKTMSANI